MDAGLEDEALFLCTRPDKTQATLLDGGSKRRDKKNCANFGNGSAFQISYHNLGAFMFIGIQVNGILKKVH